MWYHKLTLLLILIATVCQAIPQSRVILKANNNPSNRKVESFSTTPWPTTRAEATTWPTETTVRPTPWPTETTVGPTPWPTETTVGPTPWPTETTVRPTPWPTETTVGPTPWPTETTVGPTPWFTATTVGPETTTPSPSCPSPFTLEGDQCLYFATFAEQTQQESRQVCHSINGELVAIRTATQMKKIIDVIHEKGFAGKNFWIDGSDAAVEGTWLFTSGDNLPRGTPFWMASEYDHTPIINASLNCAYLYSGMGHLISDQSCYLAGSPLCEHSVQWEEKENTIMEQEPLAVECPPFYVDVSGLCLAFITWASDTWNEARQTCHGLSGELASINDIEQLRSIYLYLHGEGISGHSFWLGGSDIALEGTWTWVDGTPVPIGSPWWGNSDGNDLPEPDGGDPEDCLGITSQGLHYFRDKPCGTLLNPLCLIASGTIIEDQDFIDY